MADEKSKSNPFPLIFQTTFRGEGKQWDESCIFEIEILHFEAKYRSFLIEMLHGGGLLKNEEYKKLYVEKGEDSGHPSYSKRRASIGFSKEAFLAG